MKFSICIPVYNTGKYLFDCIRSIEKQSPVFNDYEIIIVNDGSTDNSCKIIDEISLANKKITVIHQENKGLFSARITAIKKSKGDYIISLDSDDWLETNALFILSEHINIYKSDIVIFNHKVVTKDRCIEKNIYRFDENISQEKILDDYFFSNKINNLCFKAIKKDLFDIKKIENMPKINIGEDWIHSFFPMTKAKTISYLPKAIYNYRYNENSLTKTFNDNILNTIIIINDLGTNYYMEKNNESGKIKIKVRCAKLVLKTCVFSQAKITNRKIYFSFIKKLLSNDIIIELIENTYKNMNIAYRFIAQLVLNNRKNLLWIIRCINYRFRLLIKR